MRPSNEASRVIHARLLSWEADAPADLVEMFLEPLIQALRARFPRLPDPTLVDSKVIDALLWIAKDPTSFNPEKGSLWNFLYMVAYRDLSNACRQENHWTAEIPLELVELSLVDGNRAIEEIVISRLAPAGLPEGIQMDEVWLLVEQEFSAPLDRALLELTIAGVRETWAYARVLGITAASPGEQSRQVKQAKDRIKIRLKRMGKKLSEGKELHEKEGS